MVLHMIKNEVLPVSRLIYLDLLRVISVFLVLYGHFVSVGGNATTIPGIISKDNESYLPVVSLAGTGLSILEFWLIAIFKTQAAILGVSIFFIITGYLMPKMMARYVRSEFLTNRFFRIFPTLLIANALIVVLVWIAQGIPTSWESYISSSLLIYQFVKVPPVAGVLWTLVVEVGFYLLSALLGRFTYLKVFASQLILFILLGICYQFRAGTEFYILFSFAKYFLMILIGSSIFLGETSVVKWSTKIAHFIFSIFASLLGFWFFGVSYHDTSNYSTIGTHLLAAGLFIFFILLHKKNLLRRTPGFIIFLSELVYPIYLVHTAFGLITMFLLRPYIANTYALITCAILMSVFVSWLLHICVEKPFIKIGKK